MVSVFYWTIYLHQKDVFFFVLQVLEHKRNVSLSIIEGQTENQEEF